MQRLRKNRNSIVICRITASVISIVLLSACGSETEQTNEYDESEELHLMDEFEEQNQQNELPSESIDSSLFSCPANMLVDEEGDTKVSFTGAQNFEVRLRPQRPPAMWNRESNYLFSVSSISDDEYLAIDRAVMIVHRESDDRHAESGLRYEADAMNPGVVEFENIFLGQPGCWLFNITFWDNLGKLHQATFTYEVHSRYYE